MIAVAAVLALAGWLLFDSFLAHKAAPDPSPTPTHAGVVAPPTTIPTAAVVDPGGTAPTPIPGASAPPASPSAPPPEASPTIAPREVDMAFVPVVGFWSAERAITRDQLAAALRGESERFAEVVVPAGDRQAIGDALGITVAGSVAEADPEGVRGAVGRGALGILRVVDVTPAVRALAIDGRSLFGNRRITELAEWPLRARVLDAAPAWEQAAAWTLVAGGDVMISRAVARGVFDDGRGVDFPWDGGTARILRIRCCSANGWPVPVAERTGNRGAVRDLLSGADVAMANLESSVIHDAPMVVGGLRFRGRPEMLEGIADAGIDVLSLANNHIGDGGRRGILTAIEELERLGVGHAGVGETPAEALGPAIVDVPGGRLAVFACDAIAPRYWVKPDKVGSQSCRDASLVDGIRAAEAVGDVIVVFPHWGSEYRARPRPYQRRLASEWVDAGADVVIGAHSHWAGAIEDLDGGLAFYSLGNLVFDQDWQTETQLGLVIELTFQGDRLVQAWLHPVLIMDKAQPNLLDPATDGQRVLDQVRDGSEGLLGY